MSESAVRAGSSSLKMIPFTPSSMRTIPPPEVTPPMDEAAQWTPAHHADVSWMRTV